MKFDFTDEQRSPRAVCASCWRGNIRRARRWNQETPIWKSLAGLGVLAFQCPRLPAGSAEVRSIGSCWRKRPVAPRWRSRWRTHSPCAAALARAAGAVGRRCAVIAVCETLAPSADLFISVEK